MSMHDKRPVFPTEFTNDGDMNITLPDGQVLPPGCMALVPGITLRQLYAGQALQGYLASCGPHTEPVEVASTIGSDCWKLADAVIAAEHGAPEAKPAPADWIECERIADLPGVDEALRGFSEDPTGDNGTEVVRAILEATRGAA